MGKKGKAKKNGSKESGTDHSPSTVFVSNLPYSFTKDQLEETFSDVGPIRRCFMVTPKGSTEHRGTAFVHFAVSEDANRAIELKKDTSIEGRKITVKHALHRATLEQRRAKAQELEGKPTKDAIEVDGNNAKNVDDSDIDEVENHTSTLPAAVDKVPHKVKISVEKKEAKKATQVLNDLNDKVNCSEKQRVARTVIVGGLANDVMADDVHALSKGVGTVCSVTYPLPQQVLAQHGLAQDGCKLKASAILFTSVKEARTCVRQLHQKPLKGGTLWARQLGGEGSKAQKWKIIIRNLPFKAKVNEIREMFSSAGFVWDVFVPQNPDTGLPKGFAFVKFTCKKDVENAIQKFNGQKFGTRPIAVDWAVPKKIYNNGSIDAQKDGRNIDSDSSGDDLDDDDDSDSDGDSETADVTDGNDASNETGAPEKVDLSGKVNFEEEANIARKVLQNLIASSTKGSADSQMEDGADKKDSDEPANVSALELNDDSSNPLPEKASKSKPVKVQQEEGEEDLQRTVFINNLPFDVATEEVKERFSTFGEVVSFFPVLHPVTKRPRGTGFLKFKTPEAASAAISAANVTSGMGISLKGRQLAVLKTLDKKAAHDKEVAKTKIESQDQRNLYLAKEGLILEGTPAAKGVSAGDMAKRKSLQEKKTIKLKSPNFHVSRTRLIIYNVPKSMSELALKKLCLKAVISRATKQKPVIKQVKLLKRLKDGKVVSNSRGVAFLEFTEHEHALVALRVLNNNPETFGPEHRPIVEFALDNIQTMKLRETKRQFQHQQGHANSNDAQDTDAFGTGPNGEERFGKRKFGDETRPVKNLDRNQKKSEDGSFGRSPLQDQRRFKKHERNLGSENRETQAPDAVTSDATRTRAKKGTKPKLIKERGRHPSSAMKTSDELRSKPSNSSDSQSRNRKRPQNGEEGITERKRAKKNKEHGGQDQLDMLIEKYRSKFSKPKNSEKAGGENQPKRPLKRWFQS